MYVRSLDCTQSWRRLPILNETTNGRFHQWSIYGCRGSDTGAISSFIIGISLVDMGLSGNLNKYIQGIPLKDFCSF